jgi:hypothetical protein
MIVLEHALSPSWNRKAAEVDLRAADETTLRYRCFLGDIVFEVGWIDLSARWGWVPVLDFALAMRSISAALPAVETQVFEFTESAVVATTRWTARRGTTGCWPSTGDATRSTAVAGATVPKSTRVTASPAAKHPSAGLAVATAITRRLTPTGRV